MKTSRADLKGDMTAIYKNPNVLEAPRNPDNLRLEASIQLNQLTRLNRELIDAQRQLAKKHAWLQKVSTEKSQILGMVAHDLRNPINGILNATEYLLQDATGLLGESNLTLLRAIQSSCRFMLRLINNLLEISAIESGKLRLDRKPTDILSLIQQNLSLNRPLAERKQIRIEVIADRALPLISVDPVKLNQVIDNLVTNAMKFSDPGSRIRIVSHRAGELATISVEDQGPGIPARELRAVFKLFRKGRPTDTSRTAGTGLGLAIAKRIVKAHGGQLLLESQVGKGSIFTVKLPLSTHSNAGASHRRGHPSRTAKPVVALAARESL